MADAISEVIRLTAIYPETVLHSVSEVSSRDGRASSRSVDARLHAAQTRGEIAETAESAAQKLQSENGIVAVRGRDSTLTLIRVGLRDFLRSLKNAREVAGC